MYAPTNIDVCARASVRSVPKNIRGNWYMYSSYDGHHSFSKYKFTKHTMTNWSSGHKYHYEVNVSPYVHGKWVTINPKNKTAGPTAYYRYSPIKINGKWHRSLQFREGMTYYRLFKTKVKHSYNKMVIPWN